MRSERFRVGTVSLGALLDGRINAVTFAGYSVVQFIGAVLAGYTLVWATTKEFVGSAMVTVPGGGVPTNSALLIEILLTAIFVAVILKVTTSDKFGGSALIAIPLTLVAIHFAAVPLSGASVNPARTIATAVAGNNYTDIWIYFVGPLLGAAIGWAAFRYIASDADEETAVVEEIEEAEEIETSDVLIDDSNGE